jgi:hypothetical protein
MTISNSNVGIGTIAPSATLEVSGGLPLVLNRGVAGQNNFITLLNSSSIRWGIGVANADTGSGNGGSDFNLISYTDAGAFNATPFVIRRANGYVGIGTSNPGAPLDVITGAVVVGRLGNMTGNTDVSMCVEGSANIGMYTLKGTNNNFGGISFKTLSNATLAERMRIDANTGNVGIGRTAPVVALDVGGDISGANVTLTGRITTGSANSNVVGGVLMSNGFLRPGAGNEGSPGFAFLTDVSSGIFSGGTDIVNFVTAGRNRMTVFGSNIGIGVRAPNAILDVCGGVIKIQNRASNLGGTNYLSLFDISSSSNGVARIALALNNPAVGANVGNDFAINTYDDAGSYVDTPFVVTRANGFIGMGATVPATQLDVMGAGTGNTTVLRISSGFRGSGNSNNIARLRLAHRVATGADLSYDIMANEVATANNYGLTFGGYGNEGVIRMDMGNRRLGINTVAPAYTLDVCASAGTAAVNMSTWPRTTASVCFVGTYSSLSSKAWFMTTRTSMDTNLITVADNCGTYFTINRTGIYSIFTWSGVSASSQWNTIVDASSAIAHNAMNYNIPTLGVGWGSTTLGTSTSSFTGVLPSNNSIYYKVKTDGATPNTNSRLVITFLGEAPTVASMPY